MPRRLLTLASASALVIATTCISAGVTAPSATAATTRPLRVLVTNDDGVGAPGIDALVQALRKLPNTTVTVVAPLTNQSGSGGKTTTGTPPAVTNAKTASGYPAKAVAGYPADTIVWAIDRHGLAKRPDVVLSGVNFGQNIGFLIDLSGTVGAARAAAQRGIPALAVSAGFAKSPKLPAFALAASQAVAWLNKHRAALLAGTKATVTNLNVPTCPAGKPRPLVLVKVAGKSENPGATVNCLGTAPKPTTDVGGFVHGYIVETDNLPLKPAA
jgi:5'-nucleotidase